MTTPTDDASLHACDKTEPKKTIPLDGIEPSEIVPADFRSGSLPHPQEFHKAGTELQRKREQIMLTSRMEPEANYPMPNHFIGHNPSQMMPVYGQYMHPQSNYPPYMQPENTAVPSPHTGIHAPYGSYIPAGGFFVHNPNNIPANYMHRMNPNQAMMMQQLNTNPSMVTPQHGPGYYENIMMHAAHPTSNSELNGFPQQHHQPVAVAYEPQLPVPDSFKSNHEKKSNGDDLLTVIRKNMQKKSGEVSGARWTAKEDDTLRIIVKEYRGKNWKAMAKMMPGRTGVQCLHRWNKYPGLVKGPWSKSEDELLRSYMTDRLPKDVKWAEVAQNLVGRLGKQCRERWFNHLHPDLNKGPWTEEEEAIMFKEQGKIGNKWCQIARLLPGRSENMVKNKWHSLCRKNNNRKRRKKKKEELSSRHSLNKRTKVSTKGRLGQYLVTPDNLSVPILPETANLLKGTLGHLYSTSNNMINAPLPGKMKLPNGALGQRLVASNYSAVPELGKTNE
eukprot:GSMAST32.ASY1.ANO1.1083.1 assembled CDS